MIRFMSLLTAIIFLLVPTTTFAEIKEITSEGTYNMGDGETPSVAESRALLKAKQIALEQAGTYVESYSKVKNLTLTQDEIQVLASGLMEVEVLGKKRTVVGDGINFWVKIKAKVNPDNMEEMAKRVKEKSIIDDYKRIQEAYAKSQMDIEELKKELIQTKDEKRRKKVETRIVDDEKLFQANEWLNKGYEHNINKKYEAAIDAFTKAIMLDPDNAKAFYVRGNIYYQKNQQGNAIADYTKALTLNPSYKVAYYHRGLVYIDKGQYDSQLMTLQERSR